MMPGLMMPGTMMPGTMVPDSGAPGGGSPRAQGGSDPGVLQGSATYASPSGSGTACTIAAPCALANAVAAVRGLNSNMASDIAVYLRGGTYVLTTPLVLGPQDSGSNGHQVVYQAYPGETPVLSGAAKATGFTLVDAKLGIWRAPLPKGANGRQMFVNGVRAVRARSLNGLPNVATTSTGFTIADPAYASYRNASSIEIAQDNDWKHMRCPLQGITKSGNGSALAVAPDCWAANATNVSNPGFPFNGAGLPGLNGISWLENAYELLVQPGQFYADLSAAQVFYIPRSGEDLSTADVELPVLETLVDLAGTPGHLTPTNDSDAAAVYTGSWKHDDTGNGDLDNDLHATSTSGDAVSFSFDGTGLQVIGEISSNGGPFAAYVDGTQDDAQSPTNTSTTLVVQQVIYSVTGLPKGSHTVKLVCGGSSLLVDAFVPIPDVIAPVHDITFKGTTFSYATWSLPSVSGYIDNQAAVLWDTSGKAPVPIRVPAAVQVHRGKNISFVSDRFDHLGETGLDLADGTQDSAVTGCTITDVSGGGISLGEVDDYFQGSTALMTSGDTLSDNTISHVGTDYHDAVGIWAGYVRGVTIQRNDVGHTPYSGMSFGWGWGFASSCALQAKAGLGCRSGTNYARGNQIHDNYVHDVMGTLNDGGCIYTLGGQGDGTTKSVLANNFVTVGNHTSNMLYHDEGSSYWDTHDNVTSMGGDVWLGMWTPTIHDITLGPVNFTDNAAIDNRGSNIVYTAPTVVTGGTWPAAAVAIMAMAGPSAAYRIASPLLDDDDQRMSYLGTWVAAGSRGFGDFEDNVHSTSTDGDSVSLTFSGTGVTWIGEQSSDQGHVEWFIDGQSQGMADTSTSSARKAQQPLFMSGVLVAGSHTLKVVKRGGGYMTVDAALIQAQ
jgi:hypothetical protein